MQVVHDKEICKVSQFYSCLILAFLWLWIRTLSDSNAQLFLVRISITCPPPKHTKLVLKTDDNFFTNFYIFLSQ